ncbi:MAG: diguanylate cyclase [Chromatiales bacterium]|jgi:diguanylate cyclase (GGDEF)-like protein|nr:diguanylate cyclase [Chromatiales bacterium]
MVAAKQWQPQPADMREPLAVTVPSQMEEIFRVAQQKVDRYFSDHQASSENGVLRLGGNRHILLRADVLAFEFSQTIRSVYGDSPQTNEIFLSMMFDLAHAAGVADARKFNETMHLTDPIDKLSVGPVYFAYTGFARVVIHEHSRPVANDDFVLFYRHENSFEDETWRSRDTLPESPVCIVSAGYSSGWCSESFNVPLIAVEYECGAMGNAGCEFVMAPPHRIEAYLSACAGKRHWPLYLPKFFGRQEHEERLRRLAYHDYLTGLTNRTMFMELAEHTMRIARRQNAALGLLFLDLDGFKAVNDQYGHAAGDKVLSTVGTRILERLRHSDIACRMGGDEFAVLLSEPGSTARLEQIARELIEAINEPVEYNGISLHVGASVGAAFCPRTELTFATLLERADSAMYEAKREGKNRVRLHLG